MALEEMPVDVQEHFTQMGLPDTAQIEFVFEREPEHALRKLEQLIKKLESALVVVDTLIQLVSIKDINDYARTVRALQPLLALTRRSNAHVLCLHHSRKSGGSYGEEGLGSQALSGAVDVVFSLKRGEHYRSISSTQRRGRPPGRIRAAMERGNRPGRAGGHEKGRGHRDQGGRDSCLFGRAVRAGDNGDHSGGIEVPKETT